MRLCLQFNGFVRYSIKKCLLESCYCAIGPPGGMFAAMAAKAAERNARAAVLPVI